MQGTPSSFTFTDQWKKGAKKGQSIPDGDDQGNILSSLNWSTNLLIGKLTCSFTICDHWNQRVVRWSRRSANTQEEIILINNSYCWGLATDDQKNLFVSDTDNHRIQRFSTKLYNWVFLRRSSFSVKDRSMVTCNRSFEISWTSAFPQTSISEILT